MDYDLLRVDYNICGVTYPDTLKILPASGPRIQQKFVIGDKNGVLQCLGIKDEEPIVVFKSLPGNAITSTQLAGGSGSQGDKIFAASGNEVKGYTKKGKVFLSLVTTSSETITCMSVMGGDLVLGSGRVVTHFRDLRELHSYTCDDRILDVAIFAAPNTTRLRLLVLIANKGAIMLESGQVIAKVSISAGPTRLLVPPSQYIADNNAFYGAADGSIGLITYNSVKLTSKCLMEGRGLGAVVCAGWWFSTSAHLAVGRHDGSIQLYWMDMDNLHEKLRLKFTYFCGEPVTSVSGGCVGTEEGELLVATFSGRIFALRQRRLAPGPPSLMNMPKEAVTARRSKLEAEILRLEKDVAAEREKYQRSTRTPQGGLSAPPLLEIQYELTGASIDGWQEVRIISAVPLDMLFLYSNSLLDLQTDSAAVLSVCPSQNGLMDLLATVRCQAGTRRVWIRVFKPRQKTHTSKIESTRLLIYALPAGAPRVARLMTLHLPLMPYYSEHVIEVDEVEKEIRPWCEMKVNGGFSVAEMTSWLSEIFPNELPRPAHSIVFARTHSLLQTVILCKYQRNSATFKSDNISTLANLKEIISICSVQRSITIDISTDVPESYCYEAFQRIESNFIKAYSTNQEAILLKSLISLDLDIATANNEVPQLCEDYLQIWKTNAVENQNYFRELTDTIVQWYKDWYVMSLCVDRSNDSSRIKLALEQCSIDEAKDIFLNMDIRPKSVQANTIK